MNEDPTKAPSAPWPAVLESRRGQIVKTSATSYIFWFYTASEAEALVRDWRQEMGLEHFHPIGHFCSGDFVCAHPSGTLFVVLHDDMVWWDSPVSFRELLRRLDASDAALEEDVYGHDPHA